MGSSVLMSTIGWQLVLKETGLHQCPFQIEKLFYRKYLICPALLVTNLHLLKPTHSFILPISDTLAVAVIARTGMSGKDAQTTPSFA